MPRNTRVSGHGLAAEGAAHDDVGNRTHSGTSGEGRALCSCGELSDILATGGARKRWHADHKQAAAAQADAAREGRFLAGAADEGTVAGRVEIPDTTTELFAEARRIADQIIGWAPRLMEVSADGSELAIPDEDSDVQYVLASSKYDDLEIPDGGAFLRTVADMMRIFPVLVDLAGAEETKIGTLPTGSPTITVPTPYIPFPGGRSQGSFLRRAAQNIVDGYPVGGSNVTAAVVKLLQDAGDELDRPAHGGPDQDH
ncbi:hypothetical protein ACFVAJ_17890 [Agromyces sp. NPDC057679]|uniref:hypothetical protein n=1 Tax=Agromyces sp. NPDC057679 TaxID=3346207 RepID=UPI00366F8D85